ncbi:MAG: hypothetical protein IJG63_02155 [Oscillospiraceae bacterium]|nr:hypothetical protein [Oscillospiraceae bacterium]
MNNLNTVNKNLSGGETVMLSGKDFNNDNVGTDKSDSRLWPGASADTASSGTYAWLRSHLYGGISMTPGFDDDDD